MMYAVTGASGQLGRLVIQFLLKEVSPSQVVALVRDPSKVQDLVAKGVVVRQADYDQPDSWVQALTGVKSLLLISASEVGKRVQQHRAVLEAAQKASVKFLAYTSALHANDTPLALADEHIKTEILIAQSGVQHAILRNGWYMENYAMSMQSAVAHGAWFGCAGQGQLSLASREDYAEAAAKVLLTSQEQGSLVYELAGDQGYTLADCAAEVSRQTGKSIAYNNLSEADYVGLLLKAGVPQPWPNILAQSEAATSQGALFDSSQTLSRLIGRPTQTLAQGVAAALKS